MTQNPQPEEGVSCEVVIDYTNWKGERRLRRIVPQSIVFGSTEWHPEVQWLLEAEDVEKKETRSFALNSIHAWNPTYDDVPREVEPEALIAAASKFVSGKDLFEALAEMPPINRARPAKRKPSP